MRSDCRTRASSVKCQVDAICFVQSGILSFVPIDWLLFSRDGCQVVFSYWIFARMRIIQFQFLSTLHLTLDIINKKHLRSTCYADVMQMLPFHFSPFTLHLTLSSPPFRKGAGVGFFSWLSCARRWSAESPTFLVCLLSRIYSGPPRLYTLHFTPYTAASLPINT